MGRTLEKPKTDRKPKKKRDISPVPIDINTPVLIDTISEEVIFDDPTISRASVVSAEYVVSCDNQRIVSEARSTGEVSPVAGPSRVFKDPGEVFNTPHPTRRISVIKVVLPNDRVIDTDGPDDISGVDNQNMTSAPDCNQFKTSIEALVNSALESTAALKQDNERLRMLNMKLQEALLDRSKEVCYSEVFGFPDAKWLLSVSQNADDSDYLFVKELIFRLFPQGIGNATVSGHSSNNPLGRGSKNTNEAYVRATVERLDPEKVKYVQDRLQERRLMLQDELGVAVRRARKTARHISAVIANNPSLRILRQQ
ncbi:uncharacterized protein LOC134222703 [Armigeres subalbatus]|uniref:uncharacterized protein LOC134222703 n=1 Tax=Armigeres subalbatus TaxID=124917 RepID=UPI002ED27D9E